MTAKNELEFKSFDDFVESFPNEENKKYNKSVEKLKLDSISNQKTDRKLPQSKRYYRKKNGSVISLEEYKKKKKSRNLSTSEKEYVTIQKNNLKKESQSSKKTNVTSPVKKQGKKEKTKKLINENDKDKTKKEKRKKRKIFNTSKQIEKNLARQYRYTEPKKRNILSRIILQQNLSMSKYDYIQEDYDTILPQEIEESKNASKRADRRFYKEVQKYEDAKEDITVRKGWMAFKISLGATLLAGSLALATHLSNEIKQSFNSTQSDVVVSLDTIDKEDEEYYYNIAEKFADEVRENDGYEFDYLSDEEFLDGYLKILNKEKKMAENTFRFALYNFEDQELLEQIVAESFGEEEYAMLSDEQKRDYKQLAFELLPRALPDVFGESNLYIRNPIVFDELQAKNSAQKKGYEITLVVNGDEEETVKNIGKLLHIRNTLKSVDFQVSTTNDGQDILEDMVKQALGEQYENMSEKELRDYKQIAYELLPDEVKQNYIKDPIEIENTTQDMEERD